jgi:hypothetical protein
MSVFICAVSTEGRNPTAFSLLEQTPGPAGGRPTYTVRDIGRFGDNDPFSHLRDLLAGGEEMAGQTVIVASGGRPVMERFRDEGISTVPVELGGGASRDGDTLAVTEQTLVDTFQLVYRQSIVDSPGGLDHVSEAIHALYGAMSDDAGADDASESYADVDLASGAGEPDERQGGDVSPTVVEQTGTAESASTARVGGRQEDRDMLAAGEPDVETPAGRVDQRAASEDSVDLGDQRDVALALALAVWYGEYSATEVPTTNQAGMTPRARGVRRARQEAARRG